MYVVIGTAILIWTGVTLTRIRQLKKRKNMIVHIDAAKCAGCGRCARRCSRRVLTIVETEAGPRAVVARPEKCSLCGDCLSKCNFGALNLFELETAAPAKTEETYSTHY
ncbi:MAG: 4Fe-4S dicluster domain-containing protein [Gracilibacteraceae bacterium]|jgi:ferredoxin|nr:4Fe-4S dicluster domain-containing protein [Gracilibacteraceae bacterium]